MLEKKMKKNGNNIAKIVVSGVCIALGIVLPMITGSIQALGNRFLPMHIPILLCGFLCGPSYGLAVGVITPILRSVIFTVPPMMPIAIVMAFELGAYGCITGIMYKYLPRKLPFVYFDLIVAMLMGRVVWGIASFGFAKINGAVFTWDLFLAGAFINAVPGIILQIVLVPLLVTALNRSKLINKL